jgi:hypothetical protein
MVGMTRWPGAGWRRLALLAAVCLLGAGVTGLGVVFTRQGLERADQLASVIGVFVGLAGLGVAAYSAWLTRAALAAGQATSAAERPTRSSAAGPGGAVGPRTLGARVMLGLFIVLGLTLLMPAAWSTLRPEGAPRDRPSPSTSSRNPTTTAISTTATSGGGNASTKTSAGMPVTVALSQPSSPVGSDVLLNIHVTRQPSQGNTYWLMVKFPSNGNTVYKALAQITQDRTFEHSIATAAVGSRRTYYVVEAGSPAAGKLEENLNHPEPIWDGNRTQPPDANIVSSLLEVTKARE